MIIRIQDIFIKEKLDFLTKKDKSRAGNIDKGIRKVVERINSYMDYYTTSSCSGRIVLLQRLSDKKHESGWLLKRHSKVTLKEIIDSLGRDNLSKYGLSILLTQVNNLLTISSLDLVRYKSSSNLSEMPVLPIYLINSHCEMPSTAEALAIDIPCS